MIRPVWKSNAAPTPIAIDGLSFAPTLLGKSQEPRPLLYRETPGYTGQQAIRVGDFKALRQNLNPKPRQKLNPGAWELYNIAEDPAESKNLASEKPDVLKKLEALAAEQHQKSDLFPIRALDGKN